MIVLCLIMVFGLHQQYSTGVRSRNEEETGLPLNNTAFEESPTGPPPPQPTPPGRIGTSNIISRDITYSDDDDVDGSLPAAAPLPESGNQQSRVQMRSGAVAVANVGIALPSGIPSLSSERAYAPPNHPLPALHPQPPSHASPRHGALPPHFVNDPVQPQPQKNLASAPVSPPSPRCIDDTHFFWDLNEISSFASPPPVIRTANGSHHRKVPSGSPSKADIDAICDTDLTMSDFEDSE